MTTLGRRDIITESPSREIREAARDLANRINLGEFDDLDEGPLADLRFLAEVMEHWAAMAEMLEARLAVTVGTMSGRAGSRVPFIRN